jgi:hypothetical protein
MLTKVATVGLILAVLFLAIPTPTAEAEHNCQGCAYYYSNGFVYAYCTTNVPCEQKVADVCYVYFNYTCHYEGNPCYCT